MSRQRRPPGELLTLTSYAAALRQIAIEIARNGVDLNTYLSADFPGRLNEIAADLVTYEREHGRPR